MTVHEHVVFSQGGYPIGHREPDSSYWAIRMESGHGSDVWRCELDLVDARVNRWVTQHDPMTNTRHPVDLVREQRTLDWSLDIVSSGDWRRIKELWLVCPPTRTSPTGNTARLPIMSPGTAFQFKVGVMDSSFGESLHRPLAQIIGRVTDEESGDCECFCYDYALGGLCTFTYDDEIAGPWRTNVYQMGSWRLPVPGMPSVAPIGRLSFGVLGLHFGDRLGWEDKI